MRSTPRRLVRSMMCCVLACGMAAAGTGLLGGCESHSRSRLPNADQRADRNPIDRDAFATLGYRLQWRGFAVMGKTAGIDHAVLVGDAFAVLTDDSLLTLLDSTTGEFRWTDQPASALTRFVGITRVGGRIIVASESEAFIYNAESSNLEDRQQFDVVVNTPPVAQGEMLVFGTATGEILGHLLSTGFRAWGNSLTGAIEASPARIGDAVALASSTGQVIILDPVTGVSIGRNNNAFDGPEVALASSGSAVYMASRDQSLYGISAQGRRLWRFRTQAPLTSAPTYHNGRVYATLPDMGLTAVDASSGEEVWSNEQAHGEVIGIRGGNLLVWDARGEQASTVDPATGDVIDSVRLSGVEHMVMSTFEDGEMYAVSPLGVVSKFVPRN